MTLQEEHKIRHKALQEAFDELLADYLAHNPGKRPSTTSCMELMQWASEQTQNPTEGWNQVRSIKPPALCAHCGQEIEDGHQCEETA